MSIQKFYLVRLTDRQVHILTTLLGGLTADVPTKTLKGLKFSIEKQVRMIEKRRLSREKLRAMGGS